MAVAFANIFMGKVESQILERSAKKNQYLGKGLLTIYSLSLEYNNNNN